MNFVSGIKEPALSAERSMADYACLVLPANGRIERQDRPAGLTVLQIFTEEFDDAIHDFIFDF